MPVVPTKRTHKVSNVSGAQSVDSKERKTEKMANQAEKMAGGKISIQISNILKEEDYPSDTTVVSSTSESESTTNNLNIGTAPTSIFQPSPKRLPGSSDLTSCSMLATASAGIYDLLWNKGSQMLDLIETEIDPTLLVPYFDFFDFDDRTIRKTRPIQLSTRILDLTKIPNLVHTFADYPQLVVNGFLYTRKNKFLVTEDYQRLYTLLHEHDDEFLQLSGPDIDQSRHCCISGNPGIGKSIFLDYLLIRRILEGKDTMVVRENETYAFTSDGFGIGKQLLDAYERSQSSLDKRASPCWILFDEALTSDPRCNFTKYILVTNSREETSSKMWQRECCPVFFYMDLWTWEEYWTLSLLRTQQSGEDLQLDDTGRSSKVSDETYDYRLWRICQQYGGEPRLVRALQAAYASDLEFDLNCDRYDKKLRNAVKNILRLGTLLLTPEELIRVDATLVLVIHPSGGRHRNDSYCREDESKEALAYTYTDSYNPTEQAIGFQHSVSDRESNSREPRTGYIAYIFETEFLKKTSLFKLMTRCLQFSSQPLLRSFLWEIALHLTLATCTSLVKVIDKNFCTANDCEPECKDKSAHLYYLDPIPTDVTEQLFVSALKTVPIASTFFGSTTQLKSLLTLGGPNVNESILNQYLRPSYQYLSAISGLMLHKNNHTDMITLILYQHTTSAEHPITISMLEEIWDALPEEVERGFLVFVVPNVWFQFREFGRQRYLDGGRLGRGAGMEQRELELEGVWGQRLTQVMVKADFEMVRRFCSEPVQGVGL